MRHAGRVIGPGADPARVKILQIKENRGPEILGMDQESVVRTGDGCDGGGPVDSRREDETPVIIGMFADQVYASGRSDDKRRLLPEPIGKQRNNILFQRSSGGIHRVFSKVKVRWRHDKNCTTKSGE